MSVTSKALISIATVFAGNELRRLISNVEVDDLLGPMGLQRRRSRAGGAMLFLSAGIVVGGAAAIIALKKENVVAWLSQKVEEVVDNAEELMDAADGAMEGLGDQSTLGEEVAYGDNNKQQWNRMDATPQD